MDFFNAPQIVENNDEEIDMFAELGLAPRTIHVNPSTPVIQNQVQMVDPLAATRRERRSMVV